MNTVEKRKQPPVLTAGLVSVRNDTWIICRYQANRFYSHAFTTCQWLLMSIKCTTGSSHEYYVHNRIHSWVLSYYSQTQKCTTGVTCEYFQLVSNCSWAAYFSCRTSPTHGLSSNFLKARIVTHIFCKLGCELYCIRRRVRQLRLLFDKWVPIYPLRF